MRVINHIFLAAAAAALALVSCTKETTDNTENTQGQKSGVRTITVAFANPDTRTSPTDVSGGIQPVWATGDQLTISDGSTTKTIDVPTDAVGKATFTFTTDLTGTIKVYYPGGDKYATYWDNGNVKISAKQTGEFATANLCKGTVAEDGTNLTLTNQTALFQVTPPSGVKQFTITSLKSVVDGVARTGTAQPINTDGADDAAKLIITVGNNTADLGICYVALASGVNLSDLSFEYTTDDTHGAMKGIPMKDIAEGNDKVTPGSVYTITANNWHEYVTVDGKKWATQNVAVTASGKREFGNTGLVIGDYFQWASHAGYCGSASDSDGGFLIYSSFTNKKCGDSKDEFTFKSGVAQFYTETDSDGVAWSPYCDNTTGTYDSKYSSSTKTRLDLEDDAAFYFWGGAWRMPEAGDFSNLLSKTGTTGSNFDATSGVLTINGKGLFFPAAGCGGGMELSNAGVRGDYWSSSLITGLPSNAFCLNFYVGYFGVVSSDRYFGFSVRPLSE